MQKCNYAYHTSMYTFYEESIYRYMWINICFVFFHEFRCITIHIYI